MIKGEKVKVEKEKGEEVVGGKIKKKGELNLREKKVGNDMVIQKIIRMVKDEKEEKMKIKEMVEKVKGWLVKEVMDDEEIKLVIWIEIGGKEMMGYEMVKEIEVVIIE